MRNYALGTLQFLLLVLVTRNSLAVTSLKHKKISYHRMTAMPVEILSTAAQLCEKSHLKWRMTLKITQGHRNCRCLIDHIYHFLLVFYCNNDSILRRFPDITVFTVYKTGCDLDNCFSFDKKVEITSQRALYNSPVNISLLICNATFPEEWEIERSKTAKVTLKVTQGH